MEEMEKTTPEIKPKKKKTMVTAIILIVIIIAIIGALAGGEKDKDKQDNQDNQQNQQQQQEEQNTEVDMSVVASAIKTVLDKNAEGTGIEYSLEYDDTGLVIAAKASGVAAEVAQAKADGYDDTYEPWVTMRESMVKLCNSISDAVDTLGAKDKYVTVTVVNDANEDNTLLTIMNGVVVYDVMAEK